ESGAGEGALAAPLVETLVRREEPSTRSAPPRMVRYLVDEVDERRVGAVADRLAGLGLPPGTVTVEADDGAPIDGLAVANEVLDALPTHRVVQRGADLREVRVGLGDNDLLVDVETEPSTDGLAGRLAADGVMLADGQR